MSSVYVKHFEMSNADFKIRVSSVELRYIQFRTVVDRIFCSLQVECRVSTCFFLMSSVGQF